MKRKVKIVFEGEVGIEGDPEIGCPYFQSPESCRDEDNQSGRCDARWCRNIDEENGSLYSSLNLGQLQERSFLMKLQFLLSEMSYVRNVIKSD